MTSTGRPVVLVVEDDQLVRMVAMDALAEAGFELLEAENADDAAAILSLAPRIDLLLTDVRMPGPRDGVELARAAIADHPELKVVIISGFSGYEAVGHSPISGVVFLPSPIPPRPWLRPFGRN